MQSVEIRDQVALDFLSILFFIMTTDSCMNDVCLPQIQLASHTSPSWSGTYVLRAYYFISKRWACYCGFRVSVLGDYVRVPGFLGFGIVSSNLAPLI